MTDDHISDQTRRRVLQLGGGALVAALAGCAGQGGNGGATESGMTESEMTDGTMTASEMAGGMDEDGMTETESEMTESGMDDETTERMDDEMTESEMTEGMDGSATRFRVRIENVSTGSTLDTMDGSTAVPLSPGAFAVHTESGVLFHSEEAASDGLERLAEDGMPGPLVESLGGM